MPWARQAPRIVVPAGTVTAAPSMVSSIGGGASTTGAAGGFDARAGGVSRMSVRAAQPALAECGVRIGRIASMLRPSLTAPPARAGAGRISIADDAVWPRPQIEASRMTWPISREERQLLVPWPDARPGREPRQQLLLAHAPDPARDALAARLVAEELGDAPEGVDEVGGLVEDHDHPGAEGRPDGAGRLERQRRVEDLRPDEDAGRAAEQDRADLAAAGHAAGQVDQVAQRRPELDLVGARVAPRARTGRRASARSRCRRHRSRRRPRRPSRGSAGRWPASRRC